MNLSRASVTRVRDGYLYFVLSLFCQQVSLLLKKPKQASQNSNIFFKKLAHSLQDFPYSSTIF